MTHQIPSRGRVLGIETSCDETAAAIVEGGTSVLSSVVSSQVDLHARYGGVVPEIASRAHVDLLVPVVAQAFVEAGLSDRPSEHGTCEVDAVAATYGPGLVGALLVGIVAISFIAQGSGSVVCAPATRSTARAKWSMRQARRRPSNGRWRSRRFATARSRAGAATATPGRSRSPCGS